MKLMGILYDKQYSETEKIQSDEDLVGMKDSLLSHCFWNQAEGAAESPQLTRYGCQWFPPEWNFMHGGSSGKSSPLTT